MSDPSESFHATGRFLPGVKEETSEREEDHEMTESFYGCCKSPTR
jgi:hypothetical protein